MKKKLTSVLLVDDDNDCNFFHKRLLVKMGCAEEIITAENGLEAIHFLESCNNNNPRWPAIIFLDINMPKMNGWEFLERYKKFDEQTKEKMVIVVLTTSLNPDDKEKASRIGEVKGYYNKYLTYEALEQILKERFPECIINNASL